MKKLTAFLVVASVACSLAVAAPNTHSVDSPQGFDSNEKVVTADHVVIQVADFNAALFITPVAVLVDVRPQATSTKVVAFSAAPVHWKVANRAPIVEIGLICAASPPTAPLGPDNPALAAFVHPWPTWRMPADYDPTDVVLDVA
jgi:hypothetical protein